jgi:hypothetical protein
MCDGADSKPAERDSHKTTLTMRKTKGQPPHQRQGHLDASLDEEHAAAKLIGGPQRDVGSQVVDHARDYGGRQRSALAGAQRYEELRRVEDYRVYARPLRAAGHSNLSVSSSRTCMHRHAPAALHAQKEASTPQDQMMSKVESAQTCCGNMFWLKEFLRENTEKNDVGAAQRQ